LKIGKEHYQENVLKEQYITFVYKVSGHFSPKNVNNTITCTVELPNKETLTAEKVLNFTAFGTNGSEYYLFFEPTNTYYPMIVSGKNLEVKPCLYDQHGNIIDSAMIQEIKMEENGFLTQSSDAQGHLIFELSDEDSLEKYTVAKIKAIV
jgi:hypothetical protein